MKGLNNINMKKVLADIEQIKKIQQKQNCPSHIICTLVEDGTWDINAQFYLGKQKSKQKQFNIENLLHLDEHFPDVSKETVVILDDMLLETEMYIATEIILSKGKNTIKKFIDFAINHSEIEYMAAYVKLFDDIFGIDEPDHTWQHPGHTKSVIKLLDGSTRWTTDEEEKQMAFAFEKKQYEDALEMTKEVLKDYPVLLDFYDNYKKLTIEDMVERYKDQKFFVPII